MILTKKKPAIMQDFMFYKYNQVFELVFENGVLQNFSDISDISKES